MKKSTKAIAVVVVAAVVGAWAYALYEAYAARRTVLELVESSAGRLRTVARARPSEGGDFAEHARAADASVTTLRALNPARIAELFDHADAYLVSVREIVRRRAAMETARPRLAGSLGALTKHIDADRGLPDWPRQAVELKAAAERDFRELRIATESYVSLLDSFPAAQARIAPHAKPGWIIDETTLREAREMALDALANSVENMKQATRLETYRGMQAEPAR